MTTFHELKCWPEYFEGIVTGLRTFEVRRDDRPWGGYDVGNMLRLREYDPQRDTYTGRETLARVTCVYPASGGGHIPVSLPKGIVVLGIELADPLLLPKLTTQPAHPDRYPDQAAHYWLDWTDRAQLKRSYPNVATRDGVTDFAVSCFDDLSSVRETMDRRLTECSGWRLRQGFATHETSDGVTVCTWRIRFEGADGAPL